MVWLQRWCSCLSGTEGWVIGALRDWHQRPIEHLGQTVCLRCMHEHRMCVLSSWRDLLSRAQCVREAQDAATLLAREGMEVPESPISTRRNQSIQRWESGLTVGNFTHQLLATLLLQLACTCHRCPQTTKLGLRATSAVL